MYETYRPSAEIDGLSLEASQLDPFAAIVRCGLRVRHDLADDDARELALEGAARGGSAHSAITRGGSSEERKAQDSAEDHLLGALGMPALDAMPGWRAAWIIQCQRSATTEILVATTQLRQPRLPDVSAPRQTRATRYPACLRRLREC